MWAPTAQGAELLLVPHQQHRVASHHHLTEPAGEAERWMLWWRAKAQPLMAIVALPQPPTWRPPTWLPPAWQPLWGQCQPCMAHGGRLGLGIPAGYSLSIPDVGFIADLGGDGVIAVLAGGHGWVAEGAGVCPCCVP